MSRRIIVGFDGSAPAQRALEWAIDRADAEDEIILLNAIPPGVAQSSLSGMMPAGLQLPPPLDKTFAQTAEARMQEAARAYASKGRKLRFEVRPGEPADVFMSVVRELGAHEVVIGHKSYESGELALGPIAERLVRHMPATVTVVR